MLCRVIYSLEISRSMLLNKSREIIMALSMAMINLYLWIFNGIIITFFFFFPAFVLLIIKVFMLFIHIAFAFFPFVVQCISNKKCGNLENSIMFD